MIAEGVFTFKVYCHKNRFGLCSLIRPLKDWLDVQTEILLLGRLNTSVMSFPRLMPIGSFPLLFDLKKSEHSLPIDDFLC
ncbi:hypothetical protein [Persicobacter psychrovividus]|uniref:hypothetical protein n=1 Tax=Persicobacter psychrovividus TaxID=387638 RepID=UPI0030CA13B8